MEFDSKTFILIFFKGVLELFPFGLDESSLPQTATLIQKRGSLYHSWINSDPDMSKTGPNGLNILSHLDLKTAQAIKDQDHVQAMPCCNDPALGNRNAFKK